MDDLVERLRQGEPCQPTGVCRMIEARSGCTCAEAADKIEHLLALRPPAAPADTSITQEDLRTPMTDFNRLRAERPWGYMTADEIKAAKSCIGIPPLSASAPAGAQPSEEDVARAAAIIAASPLIEAPKLPAECWHGLARQILECRG